MVSWIELANGRWRLTQRRIIVGVKYCFRYNARNRAIRNGEDPDPIGLDNMPARPHRRRREKKLMTMDEVNERFPLTKYKSWVMSRASEGLPTEGGVTAPPSRAGSVRNVEGALLSVPVEPKQASEDAKGAPVPAVDAKVNAKSSNGVNGATEEKNSLEQVQTTTSTVDKHATRTSEDEDDEDDHIHTAVPPELLTNPGDSCAICIDTLEDDDDIRGLTCGHAFHAGCLDPWLTSRRACCPLCKADYYVPKPRPEGEAADGERPSRRGNRMPAAPPPAWTGMRAARGLPGRFMIGQPDVHSNSPRPGRRRARQAAAEQAAAAARPPVNGEAPVDGAPGSVPNTSRWRPRNPFDNIHMPSFPGRNRQQAPGQSNAEPSPSQLEAGRPPVV